MCAAQALVVARAGSGSVAGAASSLWWKGANQVTRKDGTVAAITSETFTALLLMAIGSTMLTVPVVYPKLQRVAQLIFKTS